MSGLVGAALRSNENHSSWDAAIYWARKEIFNCFQGISPLLLSIFPSLLTSSLVRSFYRHQSSKRMAFACAASRYKAPNLNDKYNWNSHIGVNMLMTQYGGGYTISTRSSFALPFPSDLVATTIYNAFKDMSLWDVTVSSAEPVEPVLDDAYISCFRCSDFFEG